MPGVLPEFPGLVFKFPANTIQKSRLFACDLDTPPSNAPLASRSELVLLKMFIEHLLCALFQANYVQAFSQL